MYRIRRKWAPQFECYLWVVSRYRNDGKYHPEYYTSTWQKAMDIVNGAFR